MLRSLLIVLIAANLLFLAWTQWLAPGPTQVVSTPRVARSTPAASVAAVAPPPAPACASVGPFSDPAVPAQWQAVLQNQGFTSRIRSEQIQVSDGFWVVLSSAHSAAEQREILAALKRGGIDDAYAMPDDPSFRISVGLFVDRDHAEQRAERARHLKYTVTVEPHSHSGTQSWVDATGSSTAPLTPAQLSEWGLAAEGIGVGACPPAP